MDILLAHHRPIKMSVTVKNLIKIGQSLMSRLALGGGSFQDEHEVNNLTQNEGLEWEISEMAGDSGKKIITLITFGSSGSSPSLGLLKENLCSAEEENEVEDPLDLTPQKIMGDWPPPLDPKTAQLAASALFLIGQHQPPPSSMTSVDDHLPPKKRRRLSLTDEAIEENYCQPQSEMALKVTHKKNHVSNRCPRCHQWLENQAKLDSHQRQNGCVVVHSNSGPAQTPNHQEGEKMKKDFVNHRKKGRRSSSAIISGNNNFSQIKSVVKADGRVDEAGRHNGNILNNLLNLNYSNNPTFKYWYNFFYGYYATKLFHQSFNNRENHQGGSAEAGVGSGQILNFLYNTNPLLYHQSQLQNNYNN